MNSQEKGARVCEGRAGGTAGAAARRERAVRREMVRTRERKPASEAGFLWSLTEFGADGERSSPRRGEKIGRGQWRAVGVSWSATSGSEWAEQGKRPATEWTT